jgi:hypothetical protein
MTQVDSALVIVSEEERMKTPTMASVSYYIFVLYSVCIVNILEGLPLLLWSSSAHRWHEVTSDYWLMLCTGLHLAAVSNMPPVVLSKTKLIEELLESAVLVSVWLLKIIFWDG